MDERANILAVGSVEKIHEMQLEAIPIALLQGREVIMKAQDFTLIIHTDEQRASL